MGPHNIAATIAAYLEIKPPSGSVRVPLVNMLTGSIKINNTILFIGKTPVYVREKLEVLRGVIQDVLNHNYVYDSTPSFKGRRGKYLTIAVADRDLIKQLNVGELVILTYAEAKALSLKKVK
jgi:hypothetical protein